MDQLLLSLKEFSEILLPTLGALTLIFLIVFLYRLIKTLKRVDVTMDHVDQVLNESNDLIKNVDLKVDQLEKPLETLGFVSTTVDTVNESALGAINSSLKMYSEYSSAILGWVHGFKEKKQEAAQDEEIIQEEEDFGVYE